MKRRRSCYTIYLTSIYHVERVMSYESFSCYSKYLFSLYPINTYMKLYFYQKALFFHIFFILLAAEKAKKDETNH